MLLFLFRDRRVSRGSFFHSFLPRTVVMSHGKHRRYSRGRGTASRHRHASPVTLARRLGALDVEAFGHESVVTIRGGKAAFDESPAALRAD